MTLLTLENLLVMRGPVRIVDGASLKIGAGEVVGLIGPNGAGKTTLMRAALGLLPSEGHASIAALAPAARALAAAWLPQGREIAWPVDVETLVALGRMPWRPRGSALSEADKAAVDRALGTMGLEAFRHRPATELSGGEQARALIARALAQEAPLLLADEPIAGLDPAYQLGTMRAFGDIARAGKGVFVSLHDLPLAARACTRLVLLEQGRIAADGPPADVLTPDNVARVFGVAGTFRDGAFQVTELCP
ncbi:ABC transporter ATP-binding protein [Ovoidimarina sediminis]|uniref:ABC transporter ATP-binding protein n=1 Tax=Ovoidimarina sediminis TaxID=3079856 RepID=UPI00290EE61E|nr:ABC transporter ATP-binding protein [Rhodophyticola sp. MJ-SS7]MDU8945149.1 ABC transporter ATP-binding protein [Rhodophyticola sp. MJ-SS7]